MKNYVISTIILTLVFAFALAINAQDIKRLEKLADNLDEQANDLADKTNDDLKSKAVTGIEVERAFLAEQIKASTSLMKQLIDDKYELSELRSAGKVLLEMIVDFPKAGINMSDWNKVKNSISLLDQELNSDRTKVINQPVIVDENNISGRVFWTGMVDATVQLVIKDTQIKTITKAGKTYPDGIPSFTKSLPDSGSFSVGVKKKDGRGNVKVIQQPNAENDYTAIIEIHDEGGGAKPYTVEIFW